MPDLTPELGGKLLSMDSPTISNAIELLKVRPRREGFMGPQIVCRFPGLGRVAGLATTCTIIEYDEHYPPDPAERLVLLLEHPELPGPVNICSGTPISVRRLVEDHIAKRGARIRLNLGYYPYPDYEPRTFWGERQKLCRVLGVQ